MSNINALLQRTTSVYDAAGQSVAAINGRGYRTSHGYDRAGHRVRLTDANTNPTTYLFDAAGQDAGRIDPLLRRATFAYDLAGRRTLDLDARGARVSTAYDGAGQKVAENLSSGTRATFAYDLAGRRVLVSDATGRVTTSYDAAGQTTGASQPLGKRVTYAYDLAGWRRTLRDPDGGRTTYTHDPAGQLAGLTTPQNGRTTFAYDLAGREAVKRLANGVRVTQAYDPAGRVSGINTAGPAGLVRRLTYMLDGLGRRSGIAASDGSRTTYAYDNAGQLTREQRLTSGINLTHAYDPVGNRTVQTDSGTRTTYAYDPANQLTREQTNTARTTYAFDAAGNRVQKTDPAATTYYVWDARSRLLVAEPVAGRVTYAYDGAGRRATKNSVSGSVRFVWDFKKVLQEADGGTGATEYQFVTTEGEYGDLVSGYGNGATTYYGFDGLGSTEVLLDDTGSVTARFEYRAFGLTGESGGGDGPGLALPAPLPSELGGGVSAQTGEPFAFVGKQGYFHDTEAGLYLLGTGGGSDVDGSGRAYDPQTIVLLSKDPLGERGGQTNWYAYCANDPVNRTDPSGNRLLVPQENCIKTQGGPYGGNYASFAGDILRDELVRAYAPLDPPQDFNLPASQWLDHPNGEKYRVLKPYQSFPPSLWLKLATGKGNGKDEGLAGRLAGKIDEAARTDQVITPKCYGRLNRRTNECDPVWGLDWQRAGPAGAFTVINQFLKEFGASVVLGDKEGAKKALGELKPLAQLALVRLAEAAGIKAEDLIATLNDIGDILGDVIENPQKVLDNLIGGVGDGLKTFFAPDKVVENIQGGFATWVGTKWPDLKKAWETFPNELTREKLVTFGLGLAGLSVPDIKDTLYSVAVEAVGAGNVGRAAQVAGLLYDIAGYDAGAGDAVGAELLDVFQKFQNMVPNAEEFGQFLGDVTEQFKSFATEFLFDSAVQLGVNLISRVSGPVAIVKAIYDLLTTVLAGLRQAPDLLKAFHSGIKGIVGAPGAAQAADAVVKLIKALIPQALTFAVVVFQKLTSLDLTKAFNKLDCFIAFIRLKCRELIRKVVLAVAKPFASKTAKTPKKVVCPRCGGGAPKGSGMAPAAPGCVKPMAVPCGGAKAPAGGAAVEPGNCFRPDTRTAWFVAGQRRSGRLDEVVLGANVPTWEPGESGYAESVARPDTYFDPAVTRAVWLVREYADGNGCRVGLLRSVSWLEDQGIGGVGDGTELQLPEMGVEGTFQVLAVDPCPVIESGPGRTVTGVFHFCRGRVYDVQVAGDSVPLGVTGSHPIWSVDRCDWVPVSELCVGERVQGEGRSLTVAGIKEGTDEPVCNIEVDADHCYRVGEQGILVHNVSECKTCCPDTWCDDPYSQPGCEVEFTVGLLPTKDGHENANALVSKKINSTAELSTDDGVYIKRFCPPKIKAGKAVNFRERYHLKKPDGGCPIWYVLKRTRTQAIVNADSTLTAAEKAYWNESRQRRFDEAFLDRVWIADGDRYVAEVGRGALDPARWRAQRHIFGYRNLPANLVPGTGDARSLTDDDD